KIEEEIGDKDQIASSLRNIGIIYKELGNYTQAISYGERGLRVAREVGKLQNLELAAGQLYYSYKAAGRSKQALEMYEIYIQLRDSLNSEENQRATIRFEYQQQALADSLTNAQEKALAQVAYENQLGRQRLQLGFAAGIGGLLALLAVVLYRTSHRRRKTNELLSLQKGEIELKSNQNELLLKEIHHRVKNNLQTISSLLFLQSAHIKDAEVREAVAAGQHRVESMALIHQKLYQRDNVAAIEMRDYLQNLVQSLIDTFDADPERIRFELNMPELELDVDTAVPLGLIVNELITNSLKYAFPDGRNGKIQVSLARQPEGKLELYVADDGVGANNTPTGTSFGSQLIKLLTTQLGGTLEQGSEAGYWTRVVV
ncbi:MAG: histidine kinase, partial [Bacteroidetes bacterium]|nr:histidine kinase [Bacteroidota bacterium]